jgi:eukaryotic-like serine/threonine-protein kinase
MTSLVGRDIGKYHIEKLLGEGGMAVVYKAHDTVLDCYVAIKFIRMEAIAPLFYEKLLKRFQFEARTLASLQHPNIVVIKDYDQFEGAPYMVMDYMPNGALNPAPGCSIPYAQAALLLAPIARALEYAHRRGVIHRDIKPSNILICESGDLMLSDFGVARLLDNDGDNRLTSTGQPIGTPEYMAPEQWQARPVPQSDIYALGLVFYELVTGRRPFMADTPEAVMIKQATEPLPLPRRFVPSLPVRVEGVILKALAPKVEDRFASMEEFAMVLEKMGQGQAIEEPEPPSIDPPEVPAPVSPPESAQDGGHLPTIHPNGLRKLWPWLVGGAGMLGLLLLVVLLGVWLVKSKTPSPPVDISPGLAENPGAAVIVSETPTRLPTITTTPSLTPTAFDITVTPTWVTDTPRPALGIGSTQVSAQDGMVQVYVPAGDFLMGSDKSRDKLAYDNEMPQHTVSLDAYWIDRTEVTNAMYAGCVAARSCSPPRSFSSLRKSSYYGNGQFSNYPVLFVLWSQAQEYCTWAGRRLPSEAEWEKAARGTDGRLYAWGAGISCSKANVWIGSDGCGVSDAAAVGSYPSAASPYGALDMTGNVWEWVADWYARYSPKWPTANPTGPAGGTNHVLRGGAYNVNEQVARVADRESNLPDYASNVVGFRCAATP